MFERPAYSCPFEQGVFHSDPEPIVLEWNDFDELLHPFDESLCHGWFYYQPEGLNSVSHHREEGDTPNGVPVSDAKILDFGHLFPAAYSLFDRPPTQVSCDDLLSLFLCSNGEVGEQHHVFAKTGDYNHPESSGDILKSHGNEVECNGPLSHHMGFLVYVRDRRFEGFAQTRSEVAHQNGGTVFEYDVACLKLTDNPSPDSDDVEHREQLRRVEAAVEEPDRISTNVSENRSHRSGNGIVPTDVLRTGSGEYFLPQRQVDVPVVCRLNLDCVEPRPLPLSWIAGIPNGGQILEVLTVNLENIGQVNGDERHPVCYAGNGAHPCLSETFQTRPFSRERLVQWPRFLSECLRSVFGSRDVTHFAAAGLTDTDDTVLGQRGLFGIKLSFLRDFLDKRLYLSDTIPHQTSPFVRSIAIVFFPKSTMRDGRKVLQFFGFSLLRHDALTTRSAAWGWETPILEGTIQH